MKPDFFTFPSLPEKGGNIIFQNLKGASLSLAVTNLAQKINRPLLLLAPDNLSVSRLLDEIHYFKDAALPVVFFPDWETLPYDHFSPHYDIISERMTALNQMPTLGKGIIITTLATSLHYLPPQNYLYQFSFILKIGDVIEQNAFKKRLLESGYQLVTEVKEHGEYAIRGSIIDLFPMGSEQPFRIDLFDNEVESIRYFSPETQRSLEKVNEINLMPAKEFSLSEKSIDLFRQKWREQFKGNPIKIPLYQDVSEGISPPGIEYYLPLFFDKLVTLFDYLPSNTLLLTVNDQMHDAELFHHEVMSRYEQTKHDISRPILPPEQLFLSPNIFHDFIKSYTSININDASHQFDLRFAIESPPQFNLQSGNKDTLANLEKFLLSFPGRILICAESPGRREMLLQYFKEIKLNPPLYSSWADFINSTDSIAMTVAPIDEGFILQEPPFALITESQLFGKRVMQRRLRKKTAQDPESLIRDLTQLQVNDPVVHIDHGVGFYRGLQTITVSEQTTEFLTIEYQDAVKLYVPVSSLHLINRYTGANPDHIPINKLGTGQWSRAKRQASEKIKDVAAELLDLYAKREAREGFHYQHPEEQYYNFANAFPFEETPDQLQAIEQVFNDMMSTKPMDRVICGDVGFGKTEVALRAAFLAVHNSKQVAILVPTTLLAQQHYDNFRNRLADWPIHVELLSRFRTGKQQESVLKRMADGKVDIVIGTHKLLQKDIQFKSLGLIIIDEEHRFGVQQKEKLKSLRAEVDILTLTATPIPRTLNMALAGIRDLSVIATPPAKRLAIKTFVHEYQDSLVQEALQREIMRGGQVYFLHNDVASINKKAEELTKLVPEVRAAVAHGQMHERELEQVMSNFYHRHANVLVCSTIIESGIDIPTANTIIINRADKFGLAQLHQLRGRVGRSHHQAYAYLLTPPKNLITSDAVKRLDAISTLDNLGIGFTLATHDLEIRGAGELLGEEQSGDLHAIGFTLYMDLLTRAVNALKAGKNIDLEDALQEKPTEIDLHISALIPEDYIGDVQLRLQFYKRIANANSEATLDDIHVELIDRFGLTPQALKNLFEITLLKQKATQLGITKIAVNDYSGKIDFDKAPKVQAETIIKLIQQESARFKLEGPQRLKFSLSKPEKEHRIAEVKEVLNKLSNKS